MLTQNLIPRVREMGAKLESRLRACFAEHPHVGDIRGRGLFWGLEFVADRSTKTPFSPKLGFAGKLKKAAFDAGLICYPMAGTRDGRHGDHVLLAPPFILNETQVEEITTRLSHAINHVIASNVTG